MIEILCNKYICFIKGENFSYLGVDYNKSHPAGEKESREDDGGHVFQHGVHRGLWACRAAAGPRFLDGGWRLPIIHATVIDFLQKGIRGAGKMLNRKKVHGGSGYFHHTWDDPDLLSFLIRSRWDDVALVTREVFRECFQDLGVSLRGSFMVTWNGIRKKLHQQRNSSLKYQKHLQKQIHLNQTMNFFWKKPV